MLFSTKTDSNATVSETAVLLPDGISRRDGGFLNGCLNYGYSVLLSAFNREIVASGLLTQLGVWHDNEFNQFNFSCDLMEPLRPAIKVNFCGVTLPVAQIPVLNAFSIQRQHLSLFFKTEFGKQC